MFEVIFQIWYMYDSPKLAHIIHFIAILLSGKFQENRIMIYGIHLQLLSEKLNFGFGQVLQSDKSRPIEFYDVGLRAIEKVRFLKL